MTRALLLCALVLTACGDDGGPVKTAAELQDPNTCKACHASYFDEWSRSMHAYASDDPVFVAMNKRGQRETNNQLGTFCVQCHAPMAVALGTTDGTAFDPAALPPEQRGITCYFCHDVASITDTHNNGLQVALDQTMRGPIKHPVGNSAHHAAYDKNLDGISGDGALCGSCHDVVNANNVHLERTFAEWQTTIFAAADPKLHNTCNSCHMATSTGVIADDPDVDVPSRANGVHAHSFAGVDQAITPGFPGTDIMAMEVEDILDPSVGVLSPQKTGLGGICALMNGNQITVRTDNLSSGHDVPSGATQDRRMWFEVKAFDAGGALVFSSGVVADGEDPPDRPLGITATSMNASSGFWWDQTYTDVAMTTRAKFFWDVAAEDSNLVRPPVTTDPNDPRFDHSTTAVYGVPGGNAQLDRIEVRVLMRPIAVATLDELVASGDLDPAVRATIPAKPLQLADTYVWTRATADAATGCNPF